MPSKYAAMHKLLTLSMSARCVPTRDNNPLLTSTSQPLFGTHGEIFFYKEKETYTHLSAIEKIEKRERDWAIGRRESADNQTS